MGYVLILTFVLTGLGAYAQDKVRQPITLAEVVEMTKAGVSEELLVARIKRSSQPFDLSADEIKELTGAGVTDAVIKYLLDPALPYSPPPPEPKALPATPIAPPVPEKPQHPSDRAIPTEAGIYYWPPNRSVVRLEMRAVVPVKQSGKLVSILTVGVQKARTIGSLIGKNSSLRIPTNQLFFFARMPKDGAIEELVLVRLEPSRNRRELNFGPDHNTPRFPPSDIVQVDPRPVVPGLYQLTIAPLKPGEYFFFRMGTADAKKGILGKGFDFGVTE